MKHVLLFCFSVLYSMSAYAQWSGSTISTTTFGNASIGSSPNSLTRLTVASSVNTITTNLSNSLANSYSGTLYGINNYVSSTGTGTKYGIYTYMPNTGIGNRYALYAKTDGGGDSRAGFFDGITEAKGDFIMGANNGKFIFTHGWQGTDDFMAIVPNTAGLANTWQWGRGLTFYDSGELAKSVDNATTRAFSVNLNGTRTFQVQGNGKVYAREVEVTLAPFPDYVFEKDYSLLSLDHLRQYIAENCHLPNIPSAATVEANGIGLGELGTKQMEKIEELTLYILQLDERLKKLETENAGLKQEVETLRSAGRN